MTLEIIYQDEYLVAINKPNGLLVHRTKIAADVKENAVAYLQNQLGRKVFPIHRLDRKTSGVLLFALSAEVAKLVVANWNDDRVEKQYLAIVRGWFPDQVSLDYALTDDRGVTQSAQTEFSLLKTTELDLPFGKFRTSRYSLISAQPKTGRMHQIRKHLAHLRHPIIADRPHGCNKQNKLFKEKWRMDTMLLHAQKLILPHPISKDLITLSADENDELLRMMATLGFSDGAVSVRADPS